MHCAPSLEQQKEAETKLGQIYECFYGPVRNHSGLIEADNERKYKRKQALLIGRLHGLPHYWKIVQAVRILKHLWMLKSLLNEEQRRNIEANPNTRDS